jgi:hypothetical protein
MAIMLWKFSHFDFVVILFTYGECLHLYVTIHRFEKELSSLGDCGELHENEASQINFSRENSEIVYIF